MENITPVRSTFNEALQDESHDSTVNLQSYNYAWQATLEFLILCDALPNDRLRRPAYSSVNDNTVRGQSYARPSCIRRRNRSSNVSQMAPLQSSCGCDMNPSVSSLNENIQELELCNKNVGDDIDADTCPMCLQVWTLDGAHRLCALSCGHVFGHSCLSQRVMQDGRCPTCQKCANVQDIRFIFARKLVAIDDSACCLVTARKQLEHEQQKNTILTLELQKAKLREKYLEVELGKEKSLLEELEKVKKVQAERD